MNSPASASASSTGRAAFKQRLAPLKAWWAGLDRREQRLALLAFVVVAAFLLWMLAIRPALTTLRQASSQLDTLDAQLQSMQRLAAETRQLRAEPSISAEQSSAALQAATARLGDRARLTIQADRAVLSLNGVGGDSLRNWLSEVRSGARARPLEANLTRAGAGYSGTLVLGLGAAP